MEALLIALAAVASFLVALTTSRFTLLLLFRAMWNRR
jgi:hypothetical protein